MKQVTVLLIAILFACSAAVRAGAAGPSTAGLQVWLDASDGSTLTSEKGRLTRWRDKSGHGHDAVNKTPQSSPKVVPGAMAGKAVVRFGGKRDGLLIDGPIRPTPGPVMVFAVTQRLPAQVIGNKWQRIVGSSDGLDKADNKLPNFCVTATLDGDAKSYGPTVDDKEFTATVLGTLGIGSSPKGGNALSGDIAELLIYDRMFLSEGEVQEVLTYLSAKWQARLSQEDRGWTRTGPLGETPKAVTDAYPLSDQQNKGKWTRVEALSDEFEGKALDQAKWMDHFKDWKGRKPAWFNPENVSVSDGKLHLVMRRQEAPPAMAKLGFTSYTSAAVQSLTRAGYGYYEVKARAMNSGGSSSFWFSDTGLPKNRTEIDVFEIGGKAEGFEHKYNMNLHVWKTAQSDEHRTIGGVWNAPFLFTDAFHVYGFEWDEKDIVYYVDGVAVRRVKNKDFFYPMYLKFDSETMPTWFGMPKDEDLPSTYSIEYVRTWRRGE